MSLTKLNDVYTNWAIGDGVFTDLNLLDVPWKNTDDPNLYKKLNMSYHGAYSGDKNISPVVYKFIKDEDADAREKVATIIYTMYNDKWSKLWSLMALEYNPIENYNMTERETPAEVTHTISPAEVDTTTTPAGQTITHTPAETTETDTPTEYTETDTPTEYTETHTPAETTETLTPAETTTTETPAETTETITPAEITTTTKPPKTTIENEISAFNSGSYVDDTKSTTTGDANDKGSESIEVDAAGTNKKETDTAGTTKIEVDTAGTNAITVNHAGTDKYEVDTAGTHKFEVDTAGTHKFEVDANETTTNVVNSNGLETTRVNAAGSDVLTVQNERTLERSGNIGITTTQQMAQSEIELRKWLYFESVFKDIDNILTLSIY